QGPIWSPKMASSTSLIRCCCLSHPFQLRTQYLRTKEERHAPLLFLFLAGLNILARRLFLIDKRFKWFHYRQSEMKITRIYHNIQLLFFSLFLITACSPQAGDEVN